ncbi:RagB/SusD family nutrient uptake outer membrane protein [Sphingobacterium bovisgrunnientis]|uniref:RagB/SusD family nutrient uptake outer membrane protein n=1 Tax=Sphingobacterium bovisgrunnientis TaxID=1874697 RepID=UPI0013573B5B|nr:RagB/SusD family nutrient uptake outer membrane protein [Sphingobacterium bovisgrunnientis]
MKNFKYYFGIFFCSLTSILVGCEDFLDKKSNSSFAVPETVKDLRALLDNEDQINRYAPALLEMGNDDIFVKPDVLRSRPEGEQLIYTWQQNENRSEIASWSSPYKTIMLCNVVLESLQRGITGDEKLKKILQGEALFVRSYAFLSLAQIYCKPYDAIGSKNDLGLPLRLTSDFNVYIRRSTLEETYNQIVDDLTKSVDLLPDQVEVTTRPSKAAAYGALSRLYLLMQNYYEANEAAKNALSYNNELLDYNNLNATSAFPLGIFNKEVIYYSFTSQGLLLTAARALIPSSLYNLYDDNDLRKQIYFVKSTAGDITFKGYYSGRSSSYFAGICTDELYLIRAECEARLGNIPEGRNLLNYLLERRWKKDLFTTYAMTNYLELINTILMERRKQLVRRGLRWSDLRRLNTEDNFKTILRREIYFQGDTTIYELEPNAIQYTYPIPLPIMEWGGYIQNPI